MLGRVRSHLLGNLVGYAVLFVALGGAAYAGLKVTSGDIVNKTIKGKDVKPDSLGGKQIKEAKLGQVPSAADSDRLGGLGPGSFAPASQTRVVDIAEGAAETTVIDVEGFGELVVDANGCDATVPVGFDFRWRNTSGSGQNVWARLADTDDPAIGPEFSLLGPPPGNEYTVSFSDGFTVETRLFVTPVGDPDTAAQVSMFARLGVPSGSCRVAAQAMLPS